MSSLRRFWAFLRTQMLLAFLMFLAVVFFASASLFYTVPLWVTGLTNSIIFVIGTVVLFSRYEKMQVFDLLGKLSRIVKDFHELALKVKAQDKDTRIARVIDAVPYGTRTIADIPSEQIHVYKRGIDNAQELVDAWFDEYKEGLEFFLQNPKFQLKNFGALIMGFRRLMYDYHEKVVKESMNFIEKAGVINEEGIEKFNRFKTKYNDLANRLSSFLKDVKEAGYDIGGEGWEVDGIFKELKVKIA